jgi:phenylacetate-CoA ligase
LSQSVERVLGIRAKIQLVGPRTLQRAEGKAKRVVDRREMK